VRVNHSRSRDFVVKEPAFFYKAIIQSLSFPTKEIISESQHVAQKLGLAAIAMKYISRLYKYFLTCRWSWCPSDSQVNT